MNGIEGVETTDRQVVPSDSVDTCMNIGQHALVSKPENREPAGWHAAAARASFAFYEPDNARVRWAGGFGFDPDGVRNIEVVGYVDGHEVAVDTSLSPSGVHHTWQRRAIISDLLWHYLMKDTTHVTLPWLVTVEADDRVVTVDSQSRTFDGMRITGDRRWIGTVTLEALTLKITTSSDSAISLRVCSEPSSLPEVPPTLS